MKTTRAGALTVAVLFGLAFTGCGGSGNNNKPTNQVNSVDSVAVSPGTVTVAPSGNQLFSANVSVTGNAAKTVTWSVVEATHATGTNISSDGLLTVAADETVTTLTVKAASVADSTKSGTATVTIQGVVSVTISSAEDSVAREETLQFTPDVRVVGNVAQAVIWSVEGNQALNTTIDENGLLTVSAGESAANLTIRAVSTEDATKSGEVVITVSNPLPMYVMKPITGGTVTISSSPFGSAVYEPYAPFANATESPVTVPSFQIGETEMTYELWYPVRIWGENHGYVFHYSRLGREGNNGMDGAEPTPDRKTEPVTAISSREMVVWINAYNEMTGRAPAYYLKDTTPEQFTDTTKVVRTSEAARNASDGNGQADKAVLNPNTNVFRLPVDAEWEYAAYGGNPADVETWNYKWSGTNEESMLDDYAVYGAATTAPVKSKKPNAAGLYDMTGNVSEACLGIFAPESAMPGGEIYRIAKGGSYSTSVDDLELTNAYRGALTPSNAVILNNNRGGGGLGFRLAANGVPADTEP